VPISNLAMITSDGGFVGLINILATRGLRIDRQSGGSILVPSVAPGRWRLVYVEPSDLALAALFSGWAAMPVLATVDVAPGAVSEATLPRLGPAPKQ
jgi:hypothetical protein